MVLYIVIFPLIAAQNESENANLGPSINESAETKRRNAIMGGILGGIFGALVLGGLIFYVWRNFGSRRNRVQVLDSSSGRLSKFIRTYSLSCDSQIVILLENVCVKVTNFICRPHYTIYFD